jgi:selenocysteine lyase/cysteine desulfurase
MTDRRSFLTGGAAALAALALPLPACGPRAVGASSPAELVVPDGVDAATLARDEAFWRTVRDHYALRPDVVNLDHGWTNPPPRAATDAQFREITELAGLPAEELPRDWETVTTTETRRALAAAMEVAPTEIALVRNATEALDTVLLGLPLTAGDEVVCSPHDYYAMLDALEQRRSRDDVVLTMIRPPLPAPSLDALAERYEQAIGPRTRLVLLTHPSNLTGQLLPVRRIAAAAHRVGALVAVDGAQSLGLLPDPVRSLDCDFYGASLHKWLGVPVGLGVLWMRPEHVARVWPLVPSPPGTEGMARFEWIGTVPDLGPAALPALAMQHRLGPERKAARLRYLASQLRTKLRTAVPGARFYTMDDPAMGLGVTTVELPGVDVAALQKRLRERHAILVQAMTGLGRSPEIGGIRVTPNVYTAPDELNRFVEAVARG